MRVPRLQIDYVLVCEDIRLEVGNKPSAIGIFTDDVAPLQFPIQFPKFCFLVHGTVLDKSRRLNVTASFRYAPLPSMTLANEQELRLSTAGGGFVLNLMISPLLLTEPGQGELLLDFSGRKFRRTFNVRQADQKLLQAFGLSPKNEPVRK
jgi:hypothetical protein